MARTKTRKPKIKPAHAVAATAGKRRKGELENILIVKGKPDEFYATLRTCVEEIEMMRSRFERLEKHLPLRAAARDGALADVNTAIRMRDVELRGIVERVDAHLLDLRDRVARIETALLDVAGFHLAVQQEYDGAAGSSAPADTSEATEPQHEPHAPHDAADNANSESRMDGSTTLDNA